MDKTTLVGIVLGLVAVLVGMVLKWVAFSALFNPAALLIIFVGTAASICIAFPWQTVKKVPALLKIIFFNQQQQDLRELIEQFTDWTELTRREGLLALETKIQESDDPFLNSGLQFAIDGQTPEFIREVMLEKVDAMEKRHAEGIALFSQAGTYAPTLGVLGAVIGLIAALGNLEDMNVLGTAISAAFMATLFGIFTGYVLWHPFANKLSEKSKREVHRMELMIEGILSIASGDSPIVVKDKLSSHLTAREAAMLGEKSNEE